MKRGELHLQVKQRMESDASSPTSKSEKIIPMLEKEFRAKVSGLISHRSG